MNPQRLFMIIAILAVLGIAVSSVSLQHHYAKSKTSYCDFGESFNCDVVNRSQYSSVAGIPVALIGIAGYVTLLALATLYRDKAETPGMLLLASGAGLVFALYLTYIEGFVLQAWCILCLSSLTAIFLIATLSAILLVQSMRRSEP
jgi:vitamin-K-epoxide reductase (warfarin-sensitive)